MKTNPFKALRPTPELASLVASVPYDVVDTAEAKSLAAGNPHSFLHVVRPEIDLPEGVDIHSDEVYEQGARALQALIDKGSLLRDTAPCYYLYRQIMGDHSQVGVVACCHVDDYADDTIRKHEKTRQDKEDDRTRHVLTMNANAGPVFLTFRDTQELNAMIAEGIGESPLYDFTATDAVRHTVWRLHSDTKRWKEAFEKVPLAYVADGHHRSKAAYRAGQERRTANPDHTGEEEYNWFLAVLFPQSQLRILPYNRCVRDLNGATREEFLAKVAEVFTLEKCSRPAPDGPGQAHMYLDQWYRLSWDAFDGDPVSVLDVSVLQNRLLKPILGIDDPRTSQRIDFIGGIRGTAELERMVDGKRAAVAFSMYPCSLSQMMDIADAGQVMPPKSTWFEPKLRSGLLVHELD